MPLFKYLGKGIPNAGDHKILDKQIARLPAEFQEQIPPAEKLRDFTTREALYCLVKEIHKMGFTAEQSDWFRQIRDRAVNNHDLSEEIREQRMLLIRMGKDRNLPVWNTIRAHRKRTSTDTTRTGRPPSPEALYLPGTVVAVGDTNGDLPTLINSLQTTNLIDNQHNWTGGAVTAVSSGDIIGDRGTQGFDSLLFLHDLRDQARAVGGDIIIIAGNHEDMMLSYLTRRNGVHGTGARVAGIGTPGYEQGRGLLELLSFTEPQTDLTSSDLSLTEVIDQGRLDPQTALAAMRQDQRGQIILQEICQMQLAEVIGDTLYIHTDPTPEILALLLGRDRDYQLNGALQQNVRTINNLFQDALTQTLINGQPWTSSPQHYTVDHIMDIFLNTANRHVDDNLKKDPTKIMHAQDIEALNEQGIGRIVFGHSNLGSGNRNLRISGPNGSEITLINVDAGGNKMGTEEPNAAILYPNGGATTNTQIKLS